MNTKITPTGKVAPRKKTPGPHGKSLELAKIKRALPVVVHEHTVADHTARRYKKFGGVPNRAGRRASGQTRGVLTARPTLTPYEKGA